MEKVENKKHPVITHENITFDPETMDVNLGQLRVTSANGCTVVETKQDDDWIVMGGVQSIKIEVDVDNQIPKVTIERYVV